jgi:hypothetical protein
MTAAAIFVGKIDPKTGLPSRFGELVPFDNLTDARNRADTMVRLQGQMGRVVAYGVWQLASEFSGEVTLAPAPTAQPSTQQVQP